MNGREWNSLRKRSANPVQSVETKKKSTNIETSPSISFFSLKGTIFYVKEKEDFLKYAHLKKSLQVLSKENIFLGVKKTTTIDHISTCDEKEKDYFSEKEGIILKLKDSSTSSSNENTGEGLGPLANPLHERGNRVSPHIKDVTVTSVMFQPLQCEEFDKGTNPFDEKGDLLKEEGNPVLPNTLVQGPILLVSFFPKQIVFGDPFFEKKDCERDLLFFELVRVIEKNFLQPPLLLGGLYDGKFLDTSDLFRFFALSTTYPFLRRDLLIQINSSLSHCGNELARPSISLQNKIKGYLYQFMKVLSLFRDEKNILA